MLALGIIGLLGLIAAMAAYKLYVKPFAFLLERSAAAERARAREARETRVRERRTLLDRASAVVESVMPSLPENAEKDRQMLAAAGIKVTPQAFRVVTASAMAAAALLCAGAVSALGGNAAALFASVPAGAALGWAAVRLAVTAQTSKRRKEVENSLPGTIDLMSIMIGAGLPLERAFKEIADQAERLGAAADEFAIVDREVNRASVDFCDAMASMSKRCSSADVSAFCSALIQSRRQGSSIKAVLQSQAEYARKAHFEAVKRKINKIEVWIAIPLGLCFLPAMILLAMAPTVFQLLEQLSGLM